MEIQETIMICKFGDITTVLAMHLVTKSSKWEHYPNHSATKAQQLAMQILVHVH